MGERDRRGQPVGKTRLEHGGRSKASLSLELHDEFGDDKNLFRLACPANRLVLWGPYNFDLSLMHNPFIFELSRQIGRYATRTRFVEVYRIPTAGHSLVTILVCTH